MNFVKLGIGLLWAALMLASWSAFWRRVTAWHRTAQRLADADGCSENGKPPLDDNVIQVLEDQLRVESMLVRRAAFNAFLCSAALWVCQRAGAFSTV